MSGRAAKILRYSPCSSPTSQILWMRDGSKVGLRGASRKTFIFSPKRYFLSAKADADSIGAVQSFIKTNTESLKDNMFHNVDPL